MTKKKKISIILAMIGTSFVAGMFKVESPLTDDRRKIIRLVVKHPDIFRYAEIRRNFMVKTLKTCDDLNESNFKKYDFGDTLLSSKNGCIDKVIHTIRQGVVNTSTLDTNTGYASLYIGNTSNSFQINSVGEELKGAEAQTYMNNIEKLLRAIPKNVPDKATLKVLNIASVAYFDDFANIKYVKDYQAEKLAEEGIPYRGQF
jgi:hypothetical protein